MPGQSFASAVVVSESSRPVWRKKIRTMFVWCCYTCIEWNVMYGLKKIWMVKTQVAIYIYLVYALSLLKILTIVLEPFLEAWNLDFEHNSTYKVLNAYDEAGEEEEWENNIQWLQSLVSIKNNGHNKINDAIVFHFSDTNSFHSYAVNDFIIVQYVWNFDTNYWYKHSLRFKKSLLININLLFFVLFLFFEEEKRINILSNGILYLKLKKKGRWFVCI